MEAAPAPQITPALVAAALAAKAIVIKGMLPQIPARNLFLALDASYQVPKPELRPLEQKISNYAVHYYDAITLFLSVDMKHGNNFCY
jgi:hypothetical protein